MGPLWAHLLWPGAATYGPDLLAPTVLNPQVATVPNITYVDNCGSLQPTSLNGFYSFLVAFSGSPFYQYRVQNQKIITTRPR
jgi:hypothetical protein